jgi:glycosyltransferase involved in cell wall biosynthesis
MCLLANSFAEYGFAVDLVLASNRGPFLQDLAPSVQIIDLKARRTLFGTLGLIRYLRCANPAYLISAMSHTNVVALIAGLLTGKVTKLIVTEHISLSDLIANSSLIRLNLLPLAIFAFYRHADYVVAVSQGVADTLLGYRVPADKIKIIHNPVVSEALFTRAREPVDHPWFTAGAPPVILGVGRLVAQKDFCTLIRAFAIVRSSQMARLMILGEGDKRSELQMLAERLGVANDVSLAGFVHNPYSYMKRAGVFVLSSRFEGLPTVLIEAMACGTPIVSTDHRSGAAEILESGRWGRLTPVGDATALAEAILETLRADAHPDVVRRAASFTVNSAREGYLALMQARIVQ